MCADACMCSSHVCEYICRCMCVCEYIYMWRFEVDIRWVPQLFSTLFIDRVSPFSVRLGY